MKFSGWAKCSILLGVIALGLLITLIVVVVTDNDICSTNGLTNGKSIPDSCSGDNSCIDVSESSEPGLFDDLTTSELLSLQDYLYSAKDFNLVRPSKASLNTSYVFLTDMQLPHKAEVLDFLDGNGPKPIRRARVLVFRGDVEIPVVEEYIVQPFPNPSEHKLFELSTRPNPIPYAYRPVGVVEFNEIFNLLRTLDSELGDILKERYDATISNCGDKCITFYSHPVSSAIVGTDVRKMWFGGCFNVPYYTLHPIDFAVLVNCDGSDTSKFTIEKIEYAQQFFNSAADLKAAYNNLTKKIKIPFPTVDNNLFSSLNYRGDSSSSTKRAPRLVEPDGKRYTIKHRNVQYFDWKFDFRMSPLTGPQIYNVMYGKDRIAYEVGLQEIAVFYAGDSPAARITDYVDSGALLGTHSKSLIPGTDCPETATFISSTFLSELTEEPYTNQRSICVFEQNTGIPLKRHLSYATYEGGFYGGVMDNVLIVRSILTVVNYDYIIDFIFHQNGAMEVRAVSTGYIFSIFHNTDEDRYGFRINENILGSLHHHLFHFKVDLDIMGRSNRYETLDILTEDVDNNKWTGIPGDTYNQIYYKRSLKDTEIKAAFKYNFDAPKYHIFHNNAKPTKYGAPKAYRVQMNGMSKQTITANNGNEGTIPWARYQMAVTKYNSDEFCSSSPYKMFDARSPIVDFQKFIDDNDNIVDQDLVLWMTMGVHHIPHTEDLPITPTPGAHLSFALLPYNYFAEDPSTKSQDMVTVHLKDKKKPEDGVVYKTYTNTADVSCVAVPKDVQSDYDTNPDLVLQSKNKKSLF